MAAEDDIGVLQTVRDLRKREPFAPFRIVMTSGESYTIENSELLAIARSQLIYCLPYSDRIAHLRISEISSIVENDDAKDLKKKRVRR